MQERAKRKGLVLRDQPIAPGMRAGGGVGSGDGMAPGSDGHSGPGR